MANRSRTRDRPIISVDFSDRYDIFQTYYDSDFTENQRAAILHICTNAGRDPVPPAQAKPILLASEEAPKLASIDKKQESGKARTMGFTGDECQSCFNFTMVRNGTCLKCTTCGGTTGCS